MYICIYIFALYIGKDRLTFSVRLLPSTAQHGTVKGNHHMVADRSILRDESICGEESVRGEENVCREERSARKQTASSGRRPLREGKCLRCGKASSGRGKRLRKGSIFSQCHGKQSGCKESVCGNRKHTQQVKRLREVIGDESVCGRKASSPTSLTWKASAESVLATNDISRPTPRSQCIYVYVYIYMGELASLIKANMRLEADGTTGMEWCYGNELTPSILAIETCFMHAISKRGRPHCARPLCTGAMKTSRCSALVV